MNFIDKIKNIFSSKQSESISEKSVSYVQENLKWNNTFLGLFSFFGYKRVNDAKLIEESYLSNEDIYAILNKITMSIVDVKIVLKELKNDKFIDVIDEKNELYKILNNPNTEQSQFEYIKEKILNYFLTGSAFEYKRKAVGFNVTSSLIIIPSQFVEINLENENDFFSRVKEYVFSWITGQSYTFQKEEIIHSQNIDPSYLSKKGLSYLQPIYNTLSASNQIHVAEKSMIENRGAVGFISSASNEGYALTHEDREILDDNFKERFGGATNYNKIVTISQSAKFTQIGSNIKDMALSDLDMSKLRKFCSLFGISSQIFNDPANKTFNNLNEAKKSFYTELVIPILEILFIQIWSKDLLPEFEKKYGKKYKLALDTSKIEALQEDQKIQAEKNKIVTETVLNVATKVKNNELDFESAKNILIFTLKITEEEAVLLLPKQTII